MSPDTRPRSRLPPFLLALVAAVLGGCESDPVAQIPGSPGLRVELVAEGLDSPVHLSAPSSDPRLFIVEQEGRIRILNATGDLLPDPFLDISGRVSCCGERGLLSVAFHPDYAANGFFYVNYTDGGGDTRVERYRTSADPRVADPASATPILRVEQPFANHNGGLNLFGPDGLLYVGLGDGGSGGDPEGNGQDPTTLLGAILRIDVDGGEPYAIPPDNPFVGPGNERDEIWAYGLRNPWRFAFDPVTEDLFIADVGQNEWEEVNRVPADRAGLNYGWNVMEGPDCYLAVGCDRTGLTLPVAEYGHGDGCSITGGHVYRGSAIPDIDGHYFFADYCDGWIRSLPPGSDDTSDVVEWRVGNLGQITSFGEDGSGELYVLTRAGRVYRLAPNP